MTPAPKFALPTGTELTLAGTRMTVTGENDLGYHTVDLETGASATISFQAFIDRMKLPGASIDAIAATTGNRLRQRLGGFNIENLPKDQKTVGLFRLAFCHAMKTVRDQIRDETGNQSFELSIRIVARHRRRIRDLTQTLFGEKVHLEAPRGGIANQLWFLYQARSLMDHFRKFEAIETGQDGESPLDALVPLYHFKGNRSPRITYRVKELMTQAWEEIGLDAKGPSVGNVFRHLMMLIGEENERRRRNALQPLLVPSSSTLKAQRKTITTETEFLLATKGERHARNKRGRGSTDIRALFVGEYVEIDECKASLVVSAKRRGIWETLPLDARETLKTIDKEVRERLHILVMIDVATRMPLAWIISDQPRAQATLALLRMATRDKTREAHKFGCEGKAIGAIGIGHVKNDNGPGLRNSATISALMGMGAMNTISRAYSSTDRPYIERMFGTVESVLLKIIHGYTGRKPGELPGYDANANGVLDIEELNGILTRFMIDEYPSMRHAGVGMGMRRPIEVYKEVNETRGCFPPLDPNQRRIHLGWRQEATPSDEGVRVFKGIWFSSPELHVALEEANYHGKVSVFVDPDDITHATVLIPKVKDPIAVNIQITAFADLTLPEVLELIALWRKEDIQATVLYEDRLIRLRRDRFDQLRAIGVERKLKRSYSTIEECSRQASSLFAGARIIRNSPLAGVTPAGRVTDLAPGPTVFRIGSDDMLIDGHADKGSNDPQIGCGDLTDAELVPIEPSGDHQLATTDPTPQHGKPRVRRTEKKTKPLVLGRPQTVKKLE